MKLSWNDYQLAQNRDDFEQLDKATLEALSKVCPPAIRNPTAQARYDNAQQRILRRLAQIIEEEKLSDEAASHQKISKERDNKSPNKIHKTVVTITCGVIIGLIVALCKRQWPNLFK